jgi:two-component system, OmpR family, sensor kinase
VIRGEAEVTLRGGTRPAEEYRTALARIAEQAAHTGRLVDDLLFLARAEEGAPRLQLRAVALDALARQVVAETEGAAASAQLRLRVATEPMDLAVEADPGRMRQVLMILLDNAIRYSEPGGEVEVAVAPTPGGVLVRVTDHGIGIDPDDLPHVFERFFRGGRALERKLEGSGLGLPLAKAVVEAHGGRITVESEPGRGTVVGVVLPAAPRLRVVA